MGGYSRPWALAPYLCRSSSLPLPRRRPRCSEAGPAFGRCLALGFLPRPLALWCLEPVSSFERPCGFVLLFSGRPAGCLVCLGWCAARGLVSPGIQSPTSRYTPWSPARWVIPPLPAMQPACGSPLTALGHSPAGLGMGGWLDFASPSSLECMQPATPPPRPRIPQHRAHSQPSPNVRVSA